MKRLTAEVYELSAEYRLDWQPPNIDADAEVRRLLADNIMHQIIQHGMLKLGITKLPSGCTLYTTTLRIYHDGGVLRIEYDKLHERVKELERKLGEANLKLKRVREAVL